MAHPSPELVAARLAQKQAVLAHGPESAQARKAGSARASLELEAIRAMKRGSIRPISVSSVGPAPARGGGADPKAAAEAIRPTKRKRPGA